MTVVRLIAQTQVWDGGDLAMAGLGFDRDSGSPADDLAEFAGRNCYRSFHRPNPATEKNSDYLKHILEIGHESVLEHASATFYIEASRSVLAELSRHRHLSFSVVSQRYVDPTAFGEQTFNAPPAVSKLTVGGQAEAWEILIGSEREAISGYYRLLALFEEEGLPRKQAREAARAVLPNMTNSPMVVTGNHRAWRYVIKARWHEAADAEIRELAGELLVHLRQIAPSTYQDIPEIPYSYGG